MIASAAASVVALGPELELALEPGFVPDSEPAAEVHDYEVLTSVGRTLQIAPSAGISPGDLVRVAGEVYEVGAAKDGLLTLLQPLRKQPVDESDFERVTDFRLFCRRDAGGRVELHAD